MHTPGSSPGLLRLRQNAVVWGKHYTAPAACVPSRAAIMTGQYAGMTGVDQTDGLFKSADDTQKVECNSFLDNVEEVKAQGYLDVSGPVTQPNNVRALCTGDWKIVRYVDPRGIEADEWEIYCLTTDPIERANRVNFKTGEIRRDVTVEGMTAEELIAENAELKEELIR